METQSKMNLRNRTRKSDPPIEIDMDTKIVTSTSSEDVNVKHVCLFCFKDLGPGEETIEILEFVVPSPKKVLQIRLNDKEKNEASFELLCKLLNVSLSSQEEVVYFNREKSLPLCYKCQSLHQDMYQLQTQINELELHLLKRAELIKHIIRESDKKADYEVGSTRLKMLGLDLFRKKVISLQDNVEEFSDDKGGVLPKQSSTKPQKLAVKEEVPELNDEESSYLWVGDGSDIEDKSNELPDPECGEEDDGDPLYTPDDISKVGRGSRRGRTARKRVKTGDDTSECDKAEKPSRKERLIRRSRRGRPPKVERPPGEVVTPRKPKTSYKCHLCDEELLGYGLFKRHYAEMHPDEVRYTCKFCKLHFKALWDCRTHQRKHTGERPYTCDHCPNKFITQKCKTAHMKIYHGGNDKMFTCEHCGKTFQTDGALKIHLEVHSQAMIFCKSCSGTYKTIASFNKHNKTKHEGKAECTEPIINPDKKQLEELGVKEVKTRLVCHLCWTNLIGKLNFQQHFITEHPGQDPKQCKCGKKFSTYIDCRRHAIKHTEERNFVCDKCSHRFHTIRELNAHGKTHLPKQQDKSFICDECGMGFSNIAYLNVHRKKHTGERWVCEACGKSYSDKKGYILHKKSSHLNIRPHKCPTCPKSYTEKTQLTKHMRTHTKEKPFKCPLCDKRFPYTSSRARHVQEVHNKVTNRKSKSETLESTTPLPLINFAPIESVPNVNAETAESMNVVGNAEIPTIQPNLSIIVIRKVEETVALGEWTTI
ncbi:unnamed protein product [Orchesella dallaii]|uniref:C2H2-type domain-containing protein n=1 Tax=Orchesella dallaii TaxID=48710 RepID=A0ABP1S351_9HEXA